MKIKSVEQLREIYGWPKERTVLKTMDQLEKHSINFIHKSPFLVLCTYDSEGQADASPRGGAPGFVKIYDNSTLLIPDSKGNNRVDSLVNIVETGKIAALFLIPGIDETFRVNGTATVSIHDDYFTLFDEEKHPPKTCIVIKIEECFLHCAKALMRSRLWSEDYRQERPGFPTMGRMLSEQIGDDAHVETQEEMLKRYAKDV